VGEGAGSAGNRQRRRQMRINGVRRILLPFNRAGEIRLAKREVSTTRRKTRQLN